MGRFLEIVDNLQQCLSQISKMPQIWENVPNFKMPQISKCSKFQKCFKFQKCSKFWNCFRFKKGNFWKLWAIFGQLLANSDNFWQLLATYSNVCLSRISKMPQFSEDVQQLKMPHNSKCSKFQICSKFWKCFKYWKCSKFWNCSRLKNVNI